MTANKEEKPKLFKKRFIFLFAVLLIIGLIVADKAQTSFSEYQEQEAITQFKQSMEDADSTISMLDDAGKRLIFLQNQGNKDSLEIDSINAIFENRNSLNENDKRKLIIRIRELESRREVATEEIVLLTDTVMSRWEDHYTVTIYDTDRKDTVI